MVLGEPLERMIEGVKPHSLRTTALDLRAGWITPMFLELLLSLARVVTGSLHRDTKTSTCGSEELGSRQHQGYPSRAELLLPKDSL